MIAVLEFHPLADAFPLIEGADFDALVEDIAAHGLREPITLYQGQILDGRNRYLACLEASVDPHFGAYTGNDPVGYVVSLNLKRRHLDESQRAMVAARLATLKQGARTDLSPNGEMSQAQAASLLNVGKRSVERAAEVRDHGAQELQHAVERGEVSVSAAADVATLPEAEQVEIVARGEREILCKAAEIRARKAEIRHMERMAKLVAISAGNSALPQDRKYPVILADPPWQYKDGTDPTRDVANHYPTMALEEIRALPVSELATDDAVLFLWIPSPKLAEAMEVIAAWGFKYQTSIVWVKDKLGMGHYVRNQHELLLIASHGNMPHPLPKDRPPSIVSAPRREHSRKPDEAYELMERMYPDLPKIELFARQRRERWDAWGNQAPQLQAA
jgi:N6-adenosine-specific RNA methylase IME4